MIQEEINFLDEKRCFTILIDVAIKQNKTAKYKKRVKPEEFYLTGLVLLRDDIRINIGK